MNDKCKYCDYVTKCSRKCEYGSTLCIINRSFPKVVDKTYETILQENQQLKSIIEKTIEHIKDKINKSFNYDYGFDTRNPSDRLFAETIIELELIQEMLEDPKGGKNNER